MTELYIDKVPVILPNDFSFQIIEQNPIYTKNGTYTLEIELSLESVENQKLYGFLNRINNAAGIPKNRPALLISDNIVILNGTEIITEITEKSIKIQLVSGNSELNYLIGGDKKITGINWSDFFNPGNEYIVDFPVWSLVKNKFIKPYVFNTQDKTIIITQDGKHYHIRLYAFLNILLQDLNYSVQYNCLSQGNFQHITLINIADNLTNGLPDWTIKEFFEEIEKLFNIAFLINSDSKSVNIQFKKDATLLHEIEEINHVLDEYSNKIDEENHGDYSNQNIGYDIDYSLDNIDPIIFDKALHSLQLNYDFVKAHFSSALLPEEMKKKYIAKANDIDTEYIFGPALIATTRYPIKVNIFKPIMNNPVAKDLDVSIKIIPAKYHFEKLIYQEWYKPSPYDDDQLYDIDFIAQLPAVDISIEESSDTEEDFYLYDDINTEATTSEDSSNNIDKIYICLYNGYKELLMLHTHPDYNVDWVTAQYPVGYSDFLYEDLRKGLRYLNEDKFSLRLNHQQGLLSLFSDTLPVDTSKEYTFFFISNRKLDVRKTFLINNKLFVCKEMKKTIISSGFEKIIEGVFYPVID